MPLPSLSRTRNFVEAEINKLDAVVTGVQSAPAVTQYLVSEIILIRTASILESAIAEVAYKIAAGGICLDGTTPKLLHLATSMQSARTAMLSHSRQKAIQNLKWTRAKYISDSVKYVIDPTDHYKTTCARFGFTISEIFKVRNFAAHRSTSSRADFQTVVRLIYGRYRNMQLGYFLLSPHYVRTPNIRRYLIETKVIVNDLTKY